MNNFSQDFVIVKTTTFKYTSDYFKGCVTANINQIYYSIQVQNLVHKLVNFMNKIYFMCYYRSLTEDFVYQSRDLCEIYYVYLRKIYDKKNNISQAYTYLTSLCYEKKIYSEMRNIKHFINFTFFLKHRLLQSFQFICKT